MDETERKATHFVAFGPQRTLPGEYAKRRFTIFEVRRFCHNDGEGFWSLVGGQHQVLITMETLNTTVSNQDMASADTKNPGAAGIVIGDEVLAVIPPTDFVVLDDKAIDDIDYVFHDDETSVVPIPECEMEVWTRTS